MPNHDDQTRLAYHNDAFLDSDEARPLRMLAEYLKPLHSFRQAHIRDTIVFFGSAQLREDGPLGRFYTEARELARLCTEWSKSLPPGAQRFHARTRAEDAGVCQVRDIAEAG